MRYKVSATFSWEFDSNGTIEEASIAAREAASKMFSPSEDNCRIQVELQPIKSKCHQLVIDEYEPDEIFALICNDDQKKVFEKDGKTYAVSMNSDRYHLFKKNRFCVVCGLKGTIMVLERKAGDKNYHFNFYAIDQAGNRVMMTKDHKKAKSFGGEDCLSNYETMCSICNSLKASFPLDHETVLRMRKFRDKNIHLSKESLSKGLSLIRIGGYDYLNGQ